MGPKPHLPPLGPHGHAAATGHRDHPLTKAGCRNPASVEVWISFLAIAPTGLVAVAQ
jgi:hypothetical protein